MAKNAAANFQLIKLQNGSWLSASHQCFAHGHISITRDWILSSQVKESSVYVWRVGQKNLHLKCRLSEPVGPLVSAPSGDICFAGGLNGSIFCWEVWSGRLIRSWNAHSKAVRCLRITDDSTFLISGGDDGVVSMWSMLDIESETNILENDVMCERHSFCDHSQAITDLFVSSGGVRGRIFSASLDRTARIFDIISKQTLYVMSFDSFLTTITVSPDESSLFVGTGDGDVVIVNLWTAAQGQVASDMTIESTKSHIKLSGHSNPISSLLMEEQGSMLVSSSEDGTVKVWDLLNNQCVQTIELNQSVTCLCSIQDGELSVHNDDVLPIGPLKRSVTMRTGPSYVPFKRLNSNQLVLRS